MTENAARPNEAEWRELLEHSPLMYFVVDVSGKSRFSERVLAPRSSAITSMSWWDNPCSRSFLTRIGSAFDEMWTYAWKGPVSLNTWEARKIRKDGTTLWVGETPRLSSGRRATWSSS